MASVTAEPALVRICDLAGRSRGTAFPADRAGTLVTSHEAVDGLGRLVLHIPGGRTHVLDAEAAVTPLPHWDLALIHGPLLGLRPLVIGSDRAASPHTRVRVHLGGWTTTAIIAGTPVTYTATDRFHPLPAAVELDLPEAATVHLRLNTEASGGPVLDATTGAVLAVLGTALHAAHRSAGFAVPLRAAALDEPDGPLDALLRRNGEITPGFGPDLNLAGTLHLTARSLPDTAPRPGTPDRPDAAEALRAFEEGRTTVLALVGPPGTGRTTALAAHAARRGSGPAPAPTLWVRGGDLRTGDDSIRDALRRTLAGAGRVERATGGDTVGDPADANPDVVARLARAAGRPLLVVLDSPEEMPARLHAGLRPWTTGTAGWLRAAGARLALACGPDYWEQAGTLFPPGMLDRSPRGPVHHHGRELPDCHWLGDLPRPQADAARAALGISDATVAASEHRHPLSLHLLAAVRAAQPPGATGAPERAEILAAHLDLAALRVAERVAALSRPTPAPAVRRRLAARAAARLHEAARRSLGPVLLTRRAFEELFPWRGGWARAVLDEEILVPVGPGYRFADEEFADWLQGRHLDLDTTLHRLRTAPASDRIPHHRIGPVVQALLRLEGVHGPDALLRRLRPLLDTLTGEAPDEARWWASHLLGEVLPRLREPGRQLPVLRGLAELAGARTDGGRPFGPRFWRRLRLPADARLDLLRELLPADDPRASPATAGGRFLTLAAEALTDDPETVQPLLCRWFTDTRPLRTGGGLTVAAAAQALLHTHRARDLDGLTEALADAAHPRADELLAELVHDEPAALCRAVARWATDPRPARRVAAAVYAARLLGSVGRDSDRQRLRHACETLLASHDDTPLHPAALRVLLRDPAARSRHLPAAVRMLTVGGRDDPRATATVARALAAALPTHPEPVLAAFRYRLLADATGPELATGLLEPLAAETTPALARRITRMVTEYAAHAPLTCAGPVARFVARRLRQGPAARAVLRPLVADLLRSGSPGLRAALGGTLGRGSGELPAELLELLLADESDPRVLDAVLDAAARSGGGRELVHRLGLLMGRTPEGARLFDARLVALGREVPGFADQARGWLRRAPGDWAAVVGPSARRELDRAVGAPEPRGTPRRTEIDAAL